MRQDMVETLPTEREFASYLSSVYDFAEKSLRIHLMYYRQIRENFSTASNITQQSVREYISQIRTQYKPHSVNRRIVTLRHLCDYLVEAGAIPENYARSAKYSKLPKALHLHTLTASEVEAIIQAPIEYRFQETKIVRDALFYTLSQTGLRISEATHLRVEDIDFVQNLISIKKTKTNTPRFVPIAKTLIPILAERCRGKRQDELLFENSRGKVQEQNELRMDLRKRAELVGVTKEVRPHIFRHSFATIMLSNGCPLPQVQRLLGHVNLSTTQQYVHLEMETLRAALQTYHPLERKMRSERDVFNEIKSSIEKRIEGTGYDLSYNQEQGELRLIIRDSTLSGKALQEQPSGVEPDYGD